MRRKEGNEEGFEQGGGVNKKEIIRKRRNFECRDQKNKDIRTRTRVRSQSPGPWQSKKLRTNNNWLYQSTTNK